MAETTTTPRLMAAAKEFNIGKHTLVEFLVGQGFSRDDLKPTTKLTKEMYHALEKEFGFEKPNEIIELENQLKTKIKLSALDIIDGQIYALDLSNIDLEFIPSLGAFQMLKTLDLRRNKIKRIEGLHQMPQLERLILSNNQISKIEGLESLKNLKELYLFNNAIEEISGLESLEKLQVLNFNSNRIKAIPNLYFLQNLLDLYLNNNGIQQLESFNGLASLIRLELNQNELKSVPDLSKLEKLEVLCLNANQLADISNLRNSTSLRLLDLSSNKIRDISNLGKLTFLQLLRLSNNEISDIGVLKGLPQLQSLDISNNKINDLNPLLNLNNLAEVKLNGTPVHALVPPEVSKAGWLAIKDRLKSELKNEIVAFKEVKILILGNTNVGKSNLLEFLSSGNVPADNTTTHGIQYRIVEDQTKETHLHCWDFGGQEYFHATHRLFFSPGALHIVLWSRQNIQRNVDNPDECFDLKYWLRCIEQLIHQEPNKKIDVLVCENKIDLNDYNTTTINQTALIDKFKSLNFYFTNFSLTKGKRLSSFCEILQERSEAHFTSHSQQYRNYLDLINSTNKSVLDISEIGPDIDQVITAMNVFHNMGVLLYFPNIIENKVFVKPQALLDLIYNKILNEKRSWKIHKSEIIASVQGNLFDITADEVIKLLKYFDLIFQIQEQTDYFFVPQYLKNPPNIINFFEQHQFQKANIRIESDNYLMNIAMLRVFAVYGQFVQGKESNDYLFWKDGIVIEKNGSLLLLKFNRQDQYIELFPDVQSKNFKLQKEVVDFILQIPHQREFVSYAINEETFTVNDVNWESDYFNVWISMDGMFFTEWKTLMDNRRKNIYQIEAYSSIDMHNTFNNSKKTLSIFDYNKYLPKHDRGEMKRIFISYSKDDLQLVNKFIDHLSALKLDGKVQEWYCTELRAGSEWNFEIEDNFNKSDIICFMVSPNFMRTKYIHEVEIKKTFARKEIDEKFMIVPIILDFCRWTTTHNNLGIYTALPYTAKPVSDFNHQNMAWYVIEESLRLMIEEETNFQGEGFYSNQKLPKDVLSLFERIANKKVDNSV
jgi:small GTP-binding protein